ncbi:hypothetical protein NB714_004731 [Pantoea dispersa]|nr:hypothetical protein [Pantoea dispersa]MCW0328606.1 hypothetical protein [Pantoea dispersa]
MLVFTLTIKVVGVAMGRPLPKNVRISPAMGSSGPALRGISATGKDVSPYPSSVYGYTFIPVSSAHAFSFGSNFALYWQPRCMNTTTA